ncbi:MAG: hypothetical protein ACSNEK_06750 [Parachlamydiaceae bacterium]
MSDNLASFHLITLDASTKSTMDWQDARKEALVAIAQGKQVLWYLDMGLFYYLSAPLSQTAQFMTLRLAFDHFRDTIWEEFNQYSVGLALFKGQPDYSKDFIWDEEQRSSYQDWLKENFQEDQQLPRPEMEKIFCRDVCASYLQQLIANVSDQIPLYLIFNCANVQDPFEQLFLTCQDSYPRFHLLLENSNLALDQSANLAICWPLQEEKNLMAFDRIKKALHTLIKDQVPFKVVHESQLTTEWQGLDDLIYEPELISANGIRKLRGFEAAGGTLISLGRFLGFAEEISLENYLASHIT